MDGIDPNIQVKQEVEDTEANICIDDMVQEMQRLDREKHAQAAAQTAYSAEVLPLQQEHDENAFYNVKSTLQQTLKMCTGESDIVLDPKQASPVYDSFEHQFDRALLNRADVWHQVMVHHNNACSKQKILEMLFSTVPTHDFFPVAYRRHINVDFFLLRMCSQALNKLFDVGLKLKSGKMEIELSVRLGAARFHSGQIFPRQIITRAVQERCDNSSQYGSLNMLNLDSFASHAYLEELCINLGNRSQFEVVCSAIAQVFNNASQISALRLSNNNISHVSLLATLKGTRLMNLDLRGNRIKHPSSLRNLSDIPLLEIYLTNNNLTDVPDYQKIVRGFFPKLLHLDGSLTQSTAPKLLSSSETEEAEVEVCSSVTLLTEMDLNPSAFQKYYLSPQWHQLTVHHDGICGKQEILGALYNLLGKHNFFPCYYKTFSKRDEFLVKSCFEALLFLVKQKLTLPIPSCNVVLKLSLAMNVAEPSEKDTSPLRKLESFVRSRFQHCCLDLCDMQADLNKCQYVDFCARSPSTLTYIMNYAAEMYSHHCMILRLRHNELENCQAMESLTKFYKLVLLDLRHNSLATFADLTGIPWNNIKEVFLDNNPLCDTVPSGVEYVRRVKEYFGNLQQLDGRPLMGNFSFYQNFICTPEAYPFAEAFVRHYFTMYDSFQRNDLREVYHPQAQFSMTCSFDQDECEGSKAYQHWRPNYAQFSRNVLQCKGNLDRAMTLLIVGNERIDVVLSSFPNNEVDYYSLRIDVPVFTPERVLMIVHGRQKEDASPTGYVGFVRTWLLQPCGPGKNLFHQAMEYKIHNDMLHLYSMSEEANAAYANLNEKATESNPAMNSEPSDGDDQENALIVFQEMTRLNSEWSRRCLEESSWNLKVAFNLFLKLYESRRVPKIAFS